MMIIIIITIITSYSLVSGDRTSLI
jgi:hypothetical protein